MSQPRELFDDRLVQLIDEAHSYDIKSEEFAAASKNLRLFSECRTVLPEPDPIPDPVPTTILGKVKAGAAAVWDNETTRVLIKAGGAFGGVALVVWSTVHRDHVLEKQALAQANQRNS